MACNRAFILRFRAAGTGRSGDFSVVRGSLFPIPIQLGLQFPDSLMQLLEVVIHDIGQGDILCLQSKKLFYSI